MQVNFLYFCFVVIALRSADLGAIFNVQLLSLCKINAISSVSCFGGK